MVVFEYVEEKRREEKEKEMNWDEIDWEGLPESWEGEIMSLCDRIRKTPETPTIGLAQGSCQ